MLILSPSADSMTLAYDYIFAGLGLSTSLTLDAMIDAGHVTGKAILVIQPSGEPKNKTWCYWETSAGKYDYLLKASWVRALFTDEKRTRECMSGKFVYKCLEADSLTAFIKTKAHTAGVTFLQAHVVSIEENAAFALVHTTIGTYRASYVFSSFSAAEVTSTDEYPLVLQHFKGWFIRTAQPMPFEESTMDLMDFSTPQNNRTQFMYVLPFSENIALFEHTFFTPAPMQNEDYDTVIRQYLYQSGIKDYEIVGQEQGVIPMTAYPFPKENSKRVLYVGTAGGWTKASTGYTFTRALKYAQKIVGMLSEDDPDFSNFIKSARFAFYDRLFVEVLFHENSCGKEIFSALFSGRQPENVLSFLNEDSTVFQELKIIASCPPGPFIRAVLRVMRKIFFRRTT